MVGVDGRLDFGELQKRVASPTRAGALARDRPATFLAFDLLFLPPYGHVKVHDRQDYVSLAVYLGVAFLLGTEELRSVVGLLRRRSAGKAA